MIFFIWPPSSCSFALPPTSPKLITDPKFEMAFQDSASNRKLRQLARRLEDSESQLPCRLSPKKSLQDSLEDRLERLESSVAHYLHENEQTVADMKQYVGELGTEVEELRRLHEASGRDYLASAAEKEEEVASLAKLANLRAISLVEQIEMDLRSRETDANDLIGEEERSFTNALSASDRKAQRMLAGLYSELQNEKKLRAKGVQELSGRLQEKLDQTAAMIETEGKVRGETYRKLEQMQQDMAERLKEEFSRVVRDRKESNQAMLRLLENACDSILY